MWPFDMETGRRLTVHKDCAISTSDAVARLVVADDGRSASGTFTGPVEFMKLRAQRRPPVAHGQYVAGGVRDGAESSTTRAEEEFVRGRFAALGFALGARVPDCFSVVAD